MAYMLSHRKTKRTHYYEDIDVRNNTIINTGVLEMDLYIYHPNKQDLSKLKFPEDKLFGCELLPFLVYFDLIAQNEDCKYCHFDEKNGKKWDTNNGRRNTHFSQIAFIASSLSIVSPGTYARSLKHCGNAKQKKEAIHVMKFKDTRSVVIQCLEKNTKTKSSKTSHNGDVFFSCKMPNIQAYL